jgi:polyhydroxyalkanoate synthesis regulator phasin
MEIGTTRHVEARIEIEASTVRNVLNDEDSEIGIPTKEYGSFVEKNKLFRVQHDVLNEDVSDNPYFEKQISNLRNAALLTRNQTVIKAINELFVSQREAFVSTFTALEKVNTTIGDIVTDKTLRAQYAKIGVNSVIDGLVKLSANIDTIIDFIGMQAETLDYYKELGYEDLLATLKGMNEKIKSIDFNWDDLTEDDLAWMFRATDYIPEIKDQVFTLLQQMQDEIDAFKNGTTRQFLNLKSETESILARQYQALIEKITSSHDITTKEEIQALADRLLRVESTISEMTGGSIGVPESEIRRIVLEILQNEGLEPRVVSTINNLVDRITAQEEESNRLRQRLDALEESNTVFTQNLDSLSSSITTKFNNFTEYVDDRVSSISSALDNVEQAIEGTVKYEALTNLSSELASTKSRVQELDNRVTGLEEKVETAFTEDDVVNEEEIRSLFDFTSWIDNYEVVSEEDIYKMFDQPTDEEGNPLPTTAERVQDILDVIVDESEIYGMFPDLIEQAESQQQGD